MPFKAQFKPTNIFPAFQSPVDGGLDIIRNDLEIRMKGADYPGSNFPETKFPSS